MVTHVLLQAQILGTFVLTELVVMLTSRFWWGLVDPLACSERPARAGRPGALPRWREHQEQGYPRMAQIGRDEFPTKRILSSYQSKVSFGNNRSVFVIPAKAGIHGAPADADDIAAVQKPTPGFRQSRESGNPGGSRAAARARAPAFAGAGSGCPPSRA